MNLWLDDLRPAPDKWHWAKTVEEAIDHFQFCSASGWHIPIMSLDHDLGVTKTGYDFVKYLVERWYYYPHSEIPDAIYLHTSNPVGRGNMLQLLESHAPNQIRIFRSPEINSWEASMKKYKEGLGL